MANPRSEDPTPPVEIPDSLRGVATTFSHTCPFGCTVHVVDGVEQTHVCVGAVTINAALDRFQVTAPSGMSGVATAIAEELRPRLRELLFDAWKDGVQSGRRGPCYGVDLIPDGGGGEVPPTLSAAPTVEPDPAVAAELTAAADHIEAHGYLPPELATPAVRAVIEPLMGRPLARLVEALRAAVDSDGLRHTSTTTDPTDPRLTHGVDEEPTPQAEAYLVSEEGGFLRPVRYAYRHVVADCGAVTTMSRPIAETYARQPGFYGATYCVGCRMHLPVGQFEWVPEAGETIAPELRRVGS